MSILISVVIPNLNSPVIDRTLAALRSQDFDLSQVEVLVVGRDEPGLVRGDTLVHFVDTGEPRSAAANRNIGIAAARGDIICFTDADCTPAPDWLARLTEPLNSGAAQVVGGGILFDTGNYWILCDHISWFYLFLAAAPPGERPHLPSLNLGVRREVIQAAGLFDERYGGAAGEDTEWTLRMRARGYSLNFEPRALVTHTPARGSFRQVWRHAYEYGRHSPKLNADPAVRQGAAYRFLPRRRASMLLLTPLIASLATARILAAYWNHPKAWIASPGLWLSKVAWCLGAARMLHERQKP